MAFGLVGIGWVEPRNRPFSILRQEGSSWYCNMCIVKGFGQRQNIETGEVVDHEHLVATRASIIDHRTFL